MVWAQVGIEDSLESFLKSLTDGYTTLLGKSCGERKRCGLGALEKMNAQGLSSVELFTFIC
jgi:hypothetical protein